MNIRDQIAAVISEAEKTPVLADSTKTVISIDTLKAWAQELENQEMQILEVADAFEMKVNSAGLISELGEILK